MVRRSTSLNRAQLSVTQLEAREVPAGMIDVSYHPGDAIIVIQGDNEDNHVQVQIVPLESSGLRQVIVSSESGPIRYFNAFGDGPVITEDPIILPWSSAQGILNIDTGNGNDTIEVISTAVSNSNFFLDWGYVSIVSGNGDDQVLLDDVLAPLNVSTGHGADLVTLRNCSGHISAFDLYSFADIDTGVGDDRVVMQGTFNYRQNWIWLGAGDDVLEGDSETILPEGIVVFVDGGTGYDRVVNADYFRVQWAFSGFEEIR